jgi:hypothetical protein
MRIDIDRVTCGKETELVSGRKLWRLLWNLNLEKEIRGKVGGGGGAKPMKRAQERWFSAGRRRRRLTASGLVRCDVIGMGFWGGGSFKDCSENQVKDGKCINKQRDCILSRRNLLHETDSTDFMK